VLVSHDVSVGVGKDGVVIRLGGGVVLASLPTVTSEIGFRVQKFYLTIKRLPYCII
jgi:hypothetical protein